jgi:hypothetical protein
MKSFISPAAELQEVIKSLAFRDPKLRMDGIGQVITLLA